MASMEDSSTRRRSLLAVVVIIVSFIVIMPLPAVSSIPEFIEEWRQKLMASFDKPVTDLSASKIWKKHHSSYLSNPLTRYEGDPTFEGIHKKFLKRGYDFKKAFPKSDTEGMLPPVDEIIELMKELDVMAGEYTDESKGGASRKRRAVGTGSYSAVRQEVRTLTPAQWTVYGNAWKKTNATLADPATSSTISRLVAIVQMHRKAVAPSAHNCPSFGSWHRIFLAVIEALLQQDYPSFAFPFYDFTLDIDLPTPSDAVSYSEEFFGRTNTAGQVISGFPAAFQCPSDCSPKSLTRKFSTDKTLLYNKAAFDIMCKYTKYQDYCYPKNTTFEGNHGGPHNYIGGQMLDLACAPCDPLFFCHHSMFDYFIQCYRDKSDPVARELSTNFPAWPEIPAECARDAPAKPFTQADGVTLLANWEGLKNMYDTNIKYIKSPSTVTCTTDVNCYGQLGKPLLWCDAGKCKSKIRKDGNCKGLTSKACYQDPTCTKAVECKKKSGGLLGLGSQTLCTC